MINLLSIAEIIYSASSCDASGEPVSMEVSSDAIEFFVDYFFILAKQNLDCIFKLLRNLFQIISKLNL